ncbi:MAG: hypothetical protein LBN95_13260 [Prevotellaceae bacterium]|jgi:acyl carrier protein|nr:hypothetical protein [Prevotellaceae bacterium]
MNKKDFFASLEDYLELEGLNENSPLELSSLGILSVIALIDENFDKQYKASEIKEIKSVQELMSLIGTENFID